MAQPDFKTLIGPIAVVEINKDFYAGAPGIQTIQAAVNRAVAVGGPGQVIIPADYAGSDSISAVTGGDPSVHIIDYRLGFWQSYVWSNNAYVPEVFSTKSSIDTPVIARTVFVGVNQYSLIQDAINGAVATGQNFIIEITPGYAGNENIGSLVNGSTRVYLSDQRTDEWVNYKWNGTQYVPSDVHVGGDLMIGGDVYAANGQFTGNVTAADGIFDTCEVDNSPVRTFANTPDAPDAPTYPPAGIGVSTGTAWSPDSIDPATLATYPAAGIPQSTGTAWGPSIPANTIAYVNQANTFAADQTIETNLFVKTARISADASSLVLDAPAGAVVLNWDKAGGTIFGNGAQANAGSVDAQGKATFNGSITTTANISSGVTVPSQGGLVTGWNLTGGNGEADFICAHAGGNGGFAWYNLAAGASGTNPAHIMSLDQTGTLYVGSGDVIRIGTRTGNAWNTGMANLNSDSTNVVLNPAHGAYAVYFNYDQGTGGVHFCDGATNTVGTVDSVGNASFNGRIAATGMGAGNVANSLNLTYNTGNYTGYLRVTGANASNIPSLTIRMESSDGSQYNDALQIANTGDVYCPHQLSAANKTFRIVHPLDDTKQLVHGCLEGPESGVYYRGEGVTVNGTATITLPDYFEALTMPEGRTVYLTQIFEDDSDVVIGTNNFSMLQASRVKDGKFSVRSSEPIAKFFWEVKAIRGDISPLAVEPYREVNVTPTDEKPVKQPRQPKRNT